MYDDLGRIVQAVNSDGSITEYRYDPNGNIIAVERTNGSTLSITSFTPLITFTGQTVTVSGTGFSPASGGNAVTIGGVSATVSSASATTLAITVPAAAATGRISVTVGGVTATSGDSLVVLRPSVTSFAPRVATPGALVTLNGTNLNLVPGGTTINVDGVPVTVNSLTNVKAVFTAPASLHSGRVTVVTSYGTATTSSILVMPPEAVGAANVVDSGTLAASGADASLNINQAGKVGVFAFEGTAGQFLSLQLSSLTTVPSDNGLSYQVYTPSNGILAQRLFNSALSIHLPVLPATGIYLIAFSNEGTTGQISGHIEVNPILTTADGPLSASIPIANQTKRYVFAATAGQTFALSATSVTTTPANRAIRFDVFNASNQAIANSNGTTPAGVTVNVPSLAAGMHTAVLSLQSNTLASSMQVALAPLFGGSLPTDGSTTTFSGSAPGQIGYFTFSATAGQSLGLGVTEIAFTPGGSVATISLLSPTGTEMTWIECTPPSCQMSLRNLPVTGTYRVVMTPTGQRSMSFMMTLSQDIAGTLTAGTPQSLSLTLPGQNALLSFAATAGQAFALNLASVSTAPAGKTLLVYVYSPSGAQLTTRGATSTAPQTLNLENLSAGTYTVLLAPSDAATGSVQVTLAPKLGGTVPVDGSTSAYSSTVPGQFAYFTFAATAGQNLGVSLTSLALTPSPSGSVAVSFRLPNGSELQWWWCDTPGCSQNLVNLPATGTYTLFMDPVGYRGMSFSLTLAQ